MKCLIRTEKDANVKVISGEELVAKLRQSPSKQVRVPVSFANKVHDIGGTCASSGEITYSCDGRNDRK